MQLNLTEQHVNRVAAIAVALTALAIWAAPALATSRLNVELAGGPWAERDAVTALVSAKGSVTVESELAERSFAVDVDGEKRIKLGAARVGIWVVRFIHGGKSIVRVVTIQPEKNGRMSAVVQSVKASEEPSRGDLELLGRFYQGLSKDLLKRAVGDAWKPWATKNAVAGTTTLVICVIPGAQAACIVSVSKQAVDFGIAVLERAVELEVDAKVLKAAEAKRVRFLLGAGNFALQAIGKSPLELVFDTLVKGSEALVVDQPEAQIAIRWSADEAKKAKLLIQIVGKK